MRVFDNKEFQKLLKEFKSICRSHGLLVKRFSKDIKEGIKPKAEPSEMQGPYSAQLVLLGACTSNMISFYNYVMESMEGNNPDVKIDQQDTWSFTEEQHERLISLSNEMREILDQGYK